MLLRGSNSRGWELGATVARVVGVHGIGQQLLGSHTLGRVWCDALNDGLDRAGVPPLGDGEFACAFYGDVFRLPGRKSAQQPAYDAGDVAPGLEQELLLAWWQHVTEADSAIPAPTDTGKGRTPQLVQASLDALCRSRFFGNLTPALLVFGLKQVARYFADAKLRREIGKRVVRQIGPDTRVLVGHSLGSVVAYEVLCAYPRWPVGTLVTLGSPLGIRNLIFDRLRPPPAGGRGIWPAGVTRWVNIVDRGDVVALVKQLGPLFGDRVQDLLVHNEATAHDVIPYLTAEETGYAVATGLDG